MTAAAQMRPPLRALDQKASDAQLLEKLVQDVTVVPFGGTDREAFSISIAEVKEFWCVPTKSGKLCSDSQAHKFRLLCKARHLDPREGDAFLIGYDTQDGPVFNLITAHQALLKRAEASPRYNGMRSGVITTDGNTIFEHEGDFVPDGEKLLGAWATVYLKGIDHNPKKTIKLSTFDKGFGRWKIDPAGMIVKCCEADALRTAFPSSLAGMYVEGEHQEENERLLNTIVEQQSETQRLIQKTAAGEPEPSTSSSPQVPVSPAPKHDEPSPASHDGNRNEQRISTQQAKAVVEAIHKAGLGALGRELCNVVFKAKNTQSITTDNFDSGLLTIAALGKNVALIDACKTIDHAKGELGEDDRDYLAAYLANKEEDLGEIGAAALNKFLS